MFIVGFNLQVESARQNCMTVHTATFLRLILNFFQYSKLAWDWNDLLLEAGLSPVLVFFFNVPTINFAVRLLLFCKGISLV